MKYIQGKFLPTWEYLSNITASIGMTSPQLHKSFSFRKSVRMNTHHKGLHTHAYIHTYKLYVEIIDSISFSTKRELHSKHG